MPSPLATPILVFMATWPKMDGNGLPLGRRFFRRPRLEPPPHFMPHPKVSASHEDLRRYRPAPIQVMLSDADRELVELGSAFVKALAEAALVNKLLDRAKEYEDLTGPGSEVESARTRLMECAGESGIWLVDIKEVGKLGRLRSEFPANLLLPSDDFFHRPRWVIENGKNVPVYDGCDPPDEEAEHKWRPLYTAMINEIEQVQAARRARPFMGLFPTRPMQAAGRN